MVPTTGPTPTLADLTTLGVGGPVGRFVQAATEDDLVAAVADTDAAGTPLLLLGDGSNVIGADAGFPGTVVRVATTGVELSERGDGTVDVDVAAGEPWDALVARFVDEQLSGIEALSGIPGRTGATPIQNVGAYGQQVADTVTSVTVWDRSRRTTEVLEAQQCAFAYRDSVFKQTPGRWVVLRVRFAVRRSAESAPVRYAELARVLGVELGATAPLAAVREAVLGLRRGKGMVLDPADPDSRSAGSFFTNPVLSTEQFERLVERAQSRLGSDARVPSFADAGGVKVPAAWLVERAGFGKGYGEGRAGISTKHTLAVVNRGGATAADVLALAGHITEAVDAAFGVTLVKEPTLVGG